MPIYPISGNFSPCLSRRDLHGILLTYEVSTTNETFCARVYSTRVAEPGKKLEKGFCSSLCYWLFYADSGDLQFDRNLTLLMSEYPGCLRCNLSSRIPAILLYSKHRIKPYYGKALRILFYQYECTESRRNKGSPRGNKVNPRWFYCR
ncbi:hypothetical protein BY996DRAFT_6425770 [Phakopsora pachyrhizi]|nr:hypothetical protein BY996DRAFT_6425770 [Phakopsora pachyrhizi]